MAKNKSTNSIVEILKRAKKNPSNIHLPETHLQTADESKILRPYLEPIKTSRTPIMEDVPAATGVSLDNKLKKDSSHQNSHFKEDNFMDNDIKKNEAQLKTNLVQTECKLSTNLVQTEYKPSAQPSTNLVQTEYKPSAQPSTNLVQTEYKPSAQPSTTFKTEYKPSTTFSSLVGLQRKLVKFVYDECKIARAKTTNQLSIEYIVKTLETPYFSIKATIQRLIKKGVVIRTNLKQGRGGWVTYGVPDLVFNEILRYEETEYKPSTNLVHCSNFEQKPSAQPSTSLSSSSSYINNKNTTTNPESIDCSPLADIGFDSSHIVQIHREHLLKPELALSDKIIQDSIYALAFDLKNNNAASRFKNPPATVLVAMLKKGNPYCSTTPDKFLTPREENLQKFNAMVEHQQKRETETEAKAKQLACEQWMSAISEQELLEYVKDYTRLDGVPEKVYQTLRRKKALACAKDYFDTMIWPQKLKQILNTKQENKQ
jgi:predicted transcriptional regulator